MSAAQTYTRHALSKPLKSSKKPPRQKKPAAFVTALKWIGALAAIAVVAYGASQLSGVAYGEDQLTAVNFSALSPAGKRTALQAANRARCTCGCGLGLAQCVATDSSCPIRDANIERIKTMVREADKP